MGDVTRVAKESFEAPRLVKVYNAAGAPQPSVRRGQRAQPALQHAADPHPRDWPIRSCSSSPRSAAAFVLGDRASRDAISGRMTMGDLLGFFTALVSIAQPLRELVGVAGPLQQGIAAGREPVRAARRAGRAAGRRLTRRAGAGEVEFARSRSPTARAASGRHCAASRWRSRRVRASRSSAARAAANRRS